MKNRFHGREEKNSTKDFRVVDKIPLFKLPRKRRSNRPEYKTILHV